MRTALYLSACLLLCTLTVSVCILTGDIHRDLKSSTATLAGINGAVADVRGSVVKLNATLDNVSAASNQLQLAAGQEREYWNKTSQESAKAVRDLRQLAARLDRSVNDHLIPDLDASITSTAGAAGNSLSAIQTAAESLNTQLRDPAIAQMADHLNVAAGGIADSSKNVADATAHLDKATADIEQAVHRLTRPPSLAKRIGMGLLDVGSKLGNIVSGFIK